MAHNFDDFDAEIQSDENSDACDNWDEEQIRDNWDDLAAYDVDIDEPDTSEVDYLTEDEWQSLLDKAFDTSED